MKPPQAGMKNQGYTGEVIITQRGDTDFQTPQAVCKYMVSLIPPWVKKVLEPTPGIGNIVRELSRYQVSAPSDYWQLDPSKKFDCVVMNPPFTPMKLAYEFLFSVMQRTDCIISLMPWLTIINGERRLKLLTDFGIKSITHLPRNIFPGSRIQTCIIELNRHHKGMMEFKVFYDDLNTRKSA